MVSDTNDTVPMKMVVSNPGSGKPLKQKEPTHIGFEVNSKIKVTKRGNGIIEYSSN